MLWKTTRFRLYTLLCSLISFFLPAVQVSTQPVPLGGDFQVNTYTTDQQDYPAVAVAPDGRFVVVWQSRGSFGNDHDSRSIQGQLYSPDGSPWGAQFQVNSMPTRTQFSQPSVAMTADGGLTVVWESSESPGTDTSYLSIQGQRYAADGSPLGGQFQVNTFTTSFQVDPDIATSTTGTVVVWLSDGSFEDDQADLSIQGQLYTTDGAPMGDQFQITSTTQSYERLPSVAMEPGGEFIVVWGSRTSVPIHSRNIQGRYFASDGTPTGDQFQVNQSAKLRPEIPDVAMDASGRFAVIWSDGILGGPSVAAGLSGGYTPGPMQHNDIMVRFFERGGLALGDDFQVSETNYYAIRDAAVAAGVGGQYVVVWGDADTVDGMFVSALRGRLFSSNGIPAPIDEFQIDTNSSFYVVQTEPNAAMSPDGQLVVTWDSSGREFSDSSGRSILARRFRLPVLPVTAIPTLGTWGLLALVGVLALLALTRLRGSASAPKRLEPSKRP